MFGTIPHITLISQILKLLNNLRNIFMTGFSNGKPFLYDFFNLLMVLGPREAINPSTDLNKQSLGSEDFILILSILPNFKEISKAMYCLLFLTSLCFLTLLRPQFFMFTSMKFPSQNIFQVEQP